jgi:hypothetical protein
MPSKYHPPPYHSCDPVDWAMYSDILQDAGASRRMWRAAQLTAESLQKQPYLLLARISSPLSYLCARWVVGELAEVHSDRSRGWSDSLAWVANVPEIQHSLLRGRSNLLDVEELGAIVYLDDGQLKWETRNKHILPFLTKRWNQKRIVSAFFTAHSRRHFGNWEYF